MEINLKMQLNFLISTLYSRRSKDQYSEDDFLFYFNFDF